MEQKPPGYTSASSADDLTCQQATALLAEYVNDTLAPETMRAFQEHLRDCADCLAYLRGSSQGAHFEVYTLHSPLDAIQQR